MIFFSLIAQAQTLTVFDVDASAFPKMKAKVFAFDESGNQIPDLSKYNIVLTEDGVEKAGVKLNCPPAKPVQPLSTILTVDVSGSMCGKSLDILKAAATAWIKLLPLGKSECAITAFRSDNYFISDFTQDRAELLKSIEDLKCDDGTDFNAAFINKSAGALRVAENGKYKRVVVLFTDGFADGSKDEIIQKAKSTNTTVYCVTVDNPTPELLKDIAMKSGSQMSDTSKVSDIRYFDNVSTAEQAENIYRSILMMAQGGDPCEIEWTSGGCKPDRKAGLVLDGRHLAGGVHLSSDFSYNIPYEKLPQIKYTKPSEGLKPSEGSSIQFGKKEPGKVYTEKISITAKVEPLNIKSINSSNSKMQIVDYGGAAPPFSMNPGETRNLTVQFKPDDSSYTYSRFEIVSEACYGKYFYASGGDPKKKAVNQTIKLVFPNGDEELIAGSDTTITWEGVSPAENVKLEYTIDAGKNWKPITDTASGLRYKWHVPVPYPSEGLKPSEGSNQVLVRVTAKERYGINAGCEKQQDVVICGKIWMGCNLNVDQYRNGDPIPEVKDAKEWANLKTGAWCYYDNNPANGEKYGKLYNWYAVNDPRGLAPDGWHVPSDAEWKELEMCLGMTQTEADKSGWRGTTEGGDLKETGTEHWNSPNTGATNKHSFSALPGGWRGNDGTFGYIGSYGDWWSSTEDDATNAWGRTLGYDNANVSRNYDDKADGFSVRCLRD